MDIRKQLADEYDDELLFMDGFDDCIIGVASRCGMEPVVVYDRKQVIAKMIVQGSTEQEAIDWHEYNQAGSYVGERTPLFLDTIDK